MIVGTVGYFQLSDYRRLIADDTTWTLAVAAEAFLLRVVKKGKLLNMALTSS